MSKQESERVGPVTRILRWLWTIACSYGTSCSILIMLTFLTWRGTVDQKDIGLVGAQAKYFDSLLWYGHIGPVRIPLPGALLLQVLLAINLLCGGMLRLRLKAPDFFVLALNLMMMALLVKGWVPGSFWWHFSLVIAAGVVSTIYAYRKKSRVGIMIIHVAMAGLLTAGLVKFATSNNGYIRLWEGETGSTYTAFHENELFFAKPLANGHYEEYIVHDEAFRHLHAGGRATIQLDEVPFTLLINRFMPNSEPRNTKDGAVALVELPELDFARANQAGLLVTIDVPGEPQQSAALWSTELAPLTVQVGGEAWAIGFRRRVRDLPWSLRLDKFTKEEHPGVNTPRVFASDVTRIDAQGEQKFHIKMNSPLRYGGLTFSQNNWGPQDPRMAPSDGRRWSTLEVSQNRSDQWPKYWCFGMAFGMFVHFLAKLARYIVRSK